MPCPSVNQLVALEESTGVVLSNLQEVEVITVPYYGITVPFYGIPCPFMVFYRTVWYCRTI